MNGPFTGHAKGMCATGLKLKRSHILEICEGAIHGCYAVGAAGHGQLESWVMPQVWRIICRAAYGGQRHVLTGGVVTDAENQCLNSI